MKRFTLTRGSDVLAEGVVWNDGRVSTRRPPDYEPMFPGDDFGHCRNESILVRELPAGVSIVWIDEAHETKPAPQFDLAKHRELMAEWRERNDGADCGRVANELIAYIDEELVPVGRVRAAMPNVPGFADGEVVSADSSLAGMATRGEAATTADYVREQVTRGLPKGKLPSERAREIFASQGIAPGNMGEILEEHQTIWRVLDEFIGRKAL